MISKIRSGIHKAGYKYTIWGLLLIFIFSGTGIFIGFFTKQRNNVVATVNGYPITHKELYIKTTTLDQRIKDLKQQFGAQADAFLQMVGLVGNSEELAFKDLVQEKLLLSVADQMHLYHLSPEYVAHKLSNATFVLQNLSLIVPPFLYNNATGELDQYVLGQYLRRQNMSYADFDESIELALKQFFVRSLLPTMVFVSNKEIDQVIASDNAVRNFAVVSIDLDDYVDALQKKGVAEQDLKNYFANQNAINKRYWSTELRSGYAWKFTADAYGVAHDKFARRFTDDARRAIAQEGSKALEEFAQKHGGHKVTLKNEPFNPDSLVGAKLFSLKPAGRPGTILAQNDGYIVVLETVQERAMRPFQDVVKEVERDYLQEKAAQALMGDVAAFLKNSSPAAFEKFVKEQEVTPKKLHITGNQASAWAQVEKDGLPVERMKKMIHPGYSLGNPTQDGIKIIFLESFEPGKATTTDKAQRDLAAQKIRQQETYVMSKAFIASLQNNATIVS